MAHSTTRTPLPTRRRAKASRPAPWCFSEAKSPSPAPRERGVTLFRRLCGQTRGARADTPRRRRAGGRRCGVALGEDLFEDFADFRKLLRVLDLMAEQILDVEHVNDLLAVCRDLGARHLQAEPGQLAGQFIEQAGPVAAVDLDNGVRAARLIVDEYAGRHGEDAG